MRCTKSFTTMEAATNFPGEQLQSLERCIWRDILEQSVIIITINTILIIFVVIVAFMFFFISFCLPLMFECFCSTVRSSLSKRHKRYVNFCSALVTGPQQSIQITTTLSMQLIAVCIVDISERQTSQSCRVVDIRDKWWF